MPYRNAIPNIQIPAESNFVPPHKYKSTPPQSRRTGIHIPSFYSYKTWVQLQSKTSTNTAFVYPLLSYLYLSSVFSSKQKSLAESTRRSNRAAMTDNNNTNTNPDKPVDPFLVRVPALGSPKSRRSSSPPGFPSSPEISVTTCSTKLADRVRSLGSGYQTLSYEEDKITRLNTPRGERQRHSTRRVGNSEMRGSAERSHVHPELMTQPGVDVDLELGGTGEGGVNVNFRA
ncbi:hypothetical protein GBA52_023276 [Prunus armeniaca]|nr:hypothetical protein GBA52_023276 [Prunus armeniaca]